MRARAGLAPRAKTGTGQTGAGTAKTTQNKKKTGFLRLEIDFLEISFFFFDFGPISPEKSAVFSCFGPSVRPSDGLRNEACGTLLGSLPHGPGGCCQPATRVARTGRCVGATSRCGPAHERRSAGGRAKVPGRCRAGWQRAPGFAKRPACMQRAPGFAKRPVRAHPKPRVNSKKTGFWRSISQKSRFF